MATTHAKLTLKYTHYIHTHPYCLDSPICFQLQKVVRVTNQTILSMVFLTAITITQLTMTQHFLERERAAEHTLSMLAGHGEEARRCRKEWEQQGINEGSLHGKWSTHSLSFVCLHPSEEKGGVGRGVRPTLLKVYSKQRYNNFSNHSCMICPYIYICL